MSLAEFWIGSVIGVKVLFSICSMMVPLRTSVVTVAAVWSVVLAGTFAGMSPPVLEAADFMQEIKSECKNATGSDKAYQDLLDVLNQDTPRCFTSHVNISLLQSPADELSKQEQSKMLQQICGQIEKALVCVDPLVAKVKPCITDPDDLAILQKIVDSVPEALKMVCNDSGMMLMNLREPLSRSCAVELAPAIDDCMDEISNKTMEMDLKHYTVTECNEIYKMRDCINKRIRNCGALTYLELFSLFYRNLLSLTPCK
ncbi:uncharacterized protein LOC131434847 [Malaya genurostris]|uniref:uncharacterized protein LOC131434847 n=1 Tax=Malaya genurostris TaxID=325434 RepID=UPI0026F384F7|nr:uncharacterized protein LOC131434847 [Malaya genurostris]